MVRAADLLVRGGKTVTAGNAVPSAGELAVFCRPVVTAPALVRRDGSVAADGWLPDFVRLGELERHLGDGVIEEIVAAALAQGRLRKRERRRIMSYPLVIRLMIAMALMPDGSYCESLARLAGLLADIPFALEWHVPTEKVVTDWRALVPAEVMEDLFWQAAGPLIGDDEPSAVLLAGMTVLAADGMLVNLADTPANRAMFGSTGTGDDSAPFPQLRVVALAARAGRAMLGAVLGSSRAGEQTLLKRLARRRPELFAGRVTCFDRNFPGHELITAILDAGGHVVARVSATVALPLGARRRLAARRVPDDLAERPVRDEAGPAAGPRRRAQRGPAPRRRGRGLRDLHRDHHPPRPPGRARDQVRETYLTRWSASETTFGEDKTTITGAGNRTSGPVLRSGSPRLVISEAWAWLTATQLIRASEAAALRSEHAAARALRRKDAAPVTADEESFTAARHHMIRSMTSTQVTATSSLEALAVAADTAARACLHALNVPGRQRHSRTRAESTPEIPARHRHQDDRHRETPGHRIRPGLLLAARPGHITSGRRNRPRPPGAADRGTARQARRDTRVPPMPADRQRRHENRLKDRYGTRETTTSQKAPNT